MIFWVYSLIIKSIMLVISRRGLGILDPKEIMEVMNLRLHYVMFETPIIKVLARTTSLSNGEIRRKIKQGGIYIGDTKIESTDDTWSSGNVGEFVFVGKEPVGFIMPVKRVMESEHLV